MPIILHFENSTQQIFEAMLEISITIPWTFSHFPSAPDWLPQLVDVIFKFRIKTFSFTTFADVTTQENAKKGFYSPETQFTFRLKQSTNFLKSYVSIILSLSFPYFTHNIWANKLHLGFIQAFVVLMRHGGFATINSLSCVSIFC